LIPPPASERADEFLELVRRSRQGKLKVFLGPAAGVGKTYRMLQEAHELRRRGVDVVVGVVVTHGRPETAALVEGLEIQPPRRVSYRGLELEELDVEGLIGRAPEVAVVDEVAHTNPPGSAHRRRYQDILELLRRGISVSCAFNVQHLESLNDSVHRLTGVRVHETVPDSFLRRADQVVQVDLPADDLLERLQAGKVYPRAKVEWALENFFRRENLESLRELSLREVADKLRDASAEEAGAAASVRERVMVCLSSRSPRGRELLRRTARLSERLDAPWFAVHIQTPGETPEHIDGEAQRHLVAMQQLAQDLGAEVLQVEASDPVEGILDFARSHGITDIVLGRSAQPWYRELLGLTIPQRLLGRSQDLDLHILSLEEAPR
jgi:two-component system sensor histidine kinase KdpD